MADWVIQFRPGDSDTVPRKDGLEGVIPGSVYFHDERHATVALGDGFLCDVIGRDAESTRLGLQLYAAMRAALWQVPQEKYIDLLRAFDDEMQKSRQGYERALEGTRSLLSGNHLRLTELVTK